MCTTPASNFWNTCTTTRRKSSRQRELPYPIDTVVAAFVQALAQPAAWPALPLPPRLLRLCTDCPRALRPVARQPAGRMAAATLPAAVHGRRRPGSRTLPLSALPRPRRFTRCPLRADQERRTGQRRPPLPRRPAREKRPHRDDSRRSGRPPGRAADRRQRAVAAAGHDRRPGALPRTRPHPQGRYRARVARLRRRRHHQFHGDAQHPSARARPRHAGGQVRPRRGNLGGELRLLHGRQQRQPGSDPRARSARRAGRQGVHGSLHRQHAGGQPQHAGRHLPPLPHADHHALRRHPDDRRAARHRARSTAPTSPPASIR